MNELLALYKPIGITPLQLINQLKQNLPRYTHEKISYAGRLDPMAHGIMLFMIGDANQHREQFLNLSKTYEFEVLLGLETDTYDILGLLKPPPKSARKPIPNVNLIVNTFVNSHLGIQKQSYPPYSSRTVNGKPLFQWAKENKLSEITIPEHEIQIDEFRLLSFGTISESVLKKKVKKNIQLVNGDFRQKEILERWQELFSNTKPHTELQTAKFKISCSSGTYVRGLAHELGQTLGTGAIAIDILRTRVGNYSIENTHIKNVD